MRSDADSEKKSNMDHMAQNLQVFCVSSLDYKALTVSGAGEPKVSPLPLDGLAGVNEFIIQIL